MFNHVSARPAPGDAKLDRLMLLQAQNHGRVNQLSDELRKEISDLQIEFITTINKATAAIPAPQIHEIHTHHYEKLSAEDTARITAAKATAELAQVGHTRVAQEVAQISVAVNQQLTKHAEVFKALHEALRLANQQHVELYMQFTAYKSDLTPRLRRITILSIISIVCSAASLLALYFH